MQPFLGVLLAAGQGKRMKSQIPKALHQVAGEPMIDHAMNNLLKAGAARIIVVVGHGGDQLVEHTGIARKPCGRGNSWAAGTPPCRRSRLSRASMAP